MTTQVTHPRYPFIDGHFDTSRSSITFETINPADESLLAEVVQCEPGHVADAVESASRAQTAWWALSPSARGDALWNWGRLIEQNGDELALLDTQNNGQPLDVAREHVVGATRNAKYWGGMADKISGQQLPLTPGHLTYTRREPFGVVGVIVPWNAPMAGFTGRVSAAIACGNGVVMKPSELSPASALRLAELAVEAGIPAGLVNVVTGDGRVGQAITTHPDIHCITFTGSPSTGRLINATAAEAFKKVTLELGGKSPNIIFDDADLDAAVPGAAWSVFRNAGQMCCGGTRVLVQRSIVEDVSRRLAEVAGRIRVGDPTDPRSHVGPVVSKAQFERVVGYLELGLSEGANILIGGRRPASIPGDKGFYLSPTIFTDVTSNMRIAQEEIFGPAVVVIPFDDEEDAIRIAGDVEYGLAAMVWTRDVARMHRVANALDVGVVWGNTTIINHPGLPFGGFRNSGLGNAFGDQAIEGMTKVKRVTIRHDSSPVYPHWVDL